MVTLLPSKSSHIKYFERKFENFLDGENSQTESSPEDEFLRMEMINDILAENHRSRIHKFIKDDREAEVASNKAEFDMLSQIREKSPKTKKQEN